jgi:hypothetical protein
MKLIGSVEPHMENKKGQENSRAYSEYYPKQTVHALGYDPIPVAKDKENPEEILPDLLGIQKAHGLCSLAQKY